MPRPRATGLLCTRSYLFHAWSDFAYINICTSRFLKCANFRAWFAARRHIANTELVRLFLVSAVEADYGPFCAKASELEVIDLLLRIRDARVCSRMLDLPLPSLKFILHSFQELAGELPVGVDLVALDAKAEQVIATLPDDLRASLELKRGALASGGL